MARPPTKRSAGAAGLDEAHARKIMRKHCNDIRGIKHEPILDEELLDDSVYEPPNWTDMAEIEYQPTPDGDIKAPRPDRDLYSSAVREALQHARASTDHAKSVMTALRRILTRDKLDPIVSALNEVTCCHQAVSLAATVSALSRSTPSTLCNALTVFYEALPPSLRTSLPDVLFSVVRNTTATATGSTHSPSHDNVGDSRRRSLNGVGATPKQGNTAVAKTPAAVRTGPPPNAPTAPRSQQAHRSILSEPSYRKAEMTATSRLWPNEGHPSSRPGSSSSTAAGIHRTQSCTQSTRHLKAACATRLGQRNIARAEKLSDHIWTVPCSDQHIAAKALTTSIDIHGIVHTADYIYLKPPKAFTRGGLRTLA
ncbi:hypothetical protein LTR35_014740 [Friedmanniomyces endolithicus]|nr:hypothetical protein LTR35_014740 [Friedmanniomyces endolithicus]